MYPDTSRTSRVGHREHGFGLVTAVFLIMIMALIGFAANQLYRSGSDTSTQQLLSTRAYYAANSGLHGALAEILRGGASCSSTQLNQSFTRNGLRDCSVVVSCQSLGSGTAYQLTGRGSCQSANLSAVRVTELLVTP